MSNQELLNIKKSNALFLAFIVFFVILFGLRPVNVAFGDTVNYAYEYRAMAAGTLKARNIESEWIFSYVMYWFSQRVDVKWFFLIVEIFYIAPLYITCRRLSSQNYIPLLIFCFGAYSFLSYGVNGIRNGMAGSLVLLAIAFLLGDTRSKVICFILCFIAINCHRSIALPIVAMLVSWKYVNPRNMFLFWVLSIIISLVAGNTISGLFESLGFDDRIKQYVVSKNNSEYLSQFSQMGFRWDFLIYSAMPIWLGWYVIFKKEIYDKVYLLLLGTYIYSNAFWVMVIRSSFSNRFAYLSWFLYPIVLAYPLLKLEIWPNQGKRTAQILLAHFGFTFIMYLLGK